MHTYIEGSMSNTIWIFLGSPHPQKVAEKVKKRLQEILGLYILHTSKSFHFRYSCKEKYIYFGQAKTYCTWLSYHTDSMKPASHLSSVEPDAWVFIIQVSNSFQERGQWFQTKASFYIIVTWITLWKRQPWKPEQEGEFEIMFLDLWKEVSNCLVFK